MQTSTALIRWNLVEVTNSAFHANVDRVRTSLIVSPLGRRPSMPNFRQTEIGPYLGHLNQCLYNELNIARPNIAHAGLRGNITIIKETRLCDYIFNGKCFFLRSLKLDVSAYLYHFLQVHRFNFKKFRD